MADPIANAGILQQSRLHALPQHGSQQLLPLHKGGTAIPMHGKPSAEHKNPDLWKVSRQFEAIFLQQMMGEMRSTVTKSEFLPHGYAEDVHASMLDEAIAQASTKHSSIGIADAIYRQLDAAAQAIPNPADKPNMTVDNTLEASKHAY